jgi:predicted transposase/invertase (TIGR01784 family)
MSEDEANRMIYEARLKAQRDEYSRIQGALRKGREEGLEKGREEGLEKGREEGLEKGREEIARKALARGMSTEEVSGITGLDFERIRRLAGR